MKLALNKILFITYYLLLILSMSSCEIINPEIKIPSYMHIDSISLNTDYPTQGTNSNKITDAWIYIDGKLTGTFQMPVTFPILAEGNHNLTIRAGIIANKRVISLRVMGLMRNRK